MATNQKISPETWQEFLGNEYVELNKLLSPYAELVLKGEGWKVAESPTINKRFSQKGAIVELSKNKDGSHSLSYLSEFENDKQRKPTVVSILRDHKKDPSNKYEHLDKARMYAIKYDAATYKKFLKSYPEIEAKIAYHNNIDTPAVRAENIKAPKVYRDEEKTFLLRSASIFQVATQLGYKPKELKPGENFIPKEVVKMILPQVHLKDVVEKIQGRMRYEDNMFKIRSPFTNEDGIMNVNPGGTSFHCDVTGKGGDAITYLMEKEKMEYVGAVRYLASEYQVDIESEVAKLKNVDKVYYVKGEDKLSLKVQESGIHTFYNITRQEGGNIFKLIESDKGFDQDKAVGFLKDIFIKKVESGNVPDELLINFVKKASGFEDFRQVQNNPDTLIGALKDNPVVVTVLREMRAKQTQEQAMEATAKKFGVEVNHQTTSTASTTTPSQQRIGV